MSIDLFDEISDYELTEKLEPFYKVYKKDNEKELSDTEQQRYDNDREKMQEAFMRDQLTCITS